MSTSARAWTPTLTEREIALFDLKGYLLFPAVLSEDELAPIKAQCKKLRTDKASLPPEARCLPGGPASVLIDHPAIMRVLHTVIDDETEKSQNTVGFSAKCIIPNLTAIAGKEPEALTLYPERISALN